MITLSVQVLSICLFALEFLLVCLPAYAELKTFWENIVLFSGKFSQIHKPDQNEQRVVLLNFLLKKYFLKLAFNLMQILEIRDNHKRVCLFDESMFS